jgi:hypothetical protein
MSGLLAGSTPKYLVRLRDENGNQLDPSDTDQIKEVNIWIYNSIDGTVIAKFYLHTQPDSSWREASTKEVAPGDVRVLFYLTAAETLAAPANKNEIQVKIIVPDTDFGVPNGERTIIKTGRFSDIKPAKT